MPIFEIGEKHGFIKHGGDKAFRLFFGLVVADSQIRALLGDETGNTEKAIKEFAKDAVNNFLHLCGDNT
ncbi:MAG: hypothetical protein AAF412_04920 [Pseudomonadota bacterium]